MRRPANTTREAPYSLREIRRFVEAPLRRPLLVAAPLVLVLVGAVTLSFVLPPRYTSSTLILVAPDRIPADFVPRVSTETVGGRLQTFHLKVQSRTLLETVAHDLDPYGKVGKEHLIETIERMRDGITVSTKGGEDTFSIAFEHTDPRMAMLVADRITTTFMEEAVGHRELQVSEAYEFIQSELEEARAQVEEEALREFEARHRGSLPEQVTSNLATLRRLQMEHRTISDSLRRANETLVPLESGASVAAVGTVAAADGQPIDSPSDLR